MVAGDRRRSAASTRPSRTLFMRAMRAEGRCVAVCIADSLDLDRLAEVLQEPPAPEQGCAEAATEYLIRAERGEAGHGSAPSWSRPSPAARPTGSSSSRAQASGSNATSARVDVSGIELMRIFGSSENMVLHIELRRGKDGDLVSKDLFAFRFGAIVSWGFHSRERAAIRKLLNHFAVRPLPRDEIDEDFMEYVIRREGDGEEEEEDDDPAGAGAIKHDQIILNWSHQFEKLAHSYALAQSVRLGVFEVVVDRSIATTQSIPETMAATGEVMLDARELSKRLGGLLMLRCNVNLHTDILDTPDILWDEDFFLPLYVACRDYMDIDKRVEILNQRLGVLKDLYDLLQNTLNVTHSNKLEWIVIILILVEVLLELLELVHDAWTKG